jgi:hypothetical protein
MASYDAEIVAYNIVIYSHFMMGTESVPCEGRNPAGGHPYSFPCTDLHPPEWHS